MQIAFLTDSTLGLSPAETEKRGYAFVPQQVVLDGKAYRDHLEIDSTQIYTAQREGRKLGTSQVAPADFETAYRKLLNDHDHVVSVHISSRLSGTVETARMVAQSHFPGQVTVVDSLSINGGLGFVLQRVQQLAAQEVPLNQLESRLGNYREQIRGYVLPQTLTFLARSGRVPGLVAFLGNLINLVPLLSVQDGVIKPLERVRGYNKGLEVLLQHLNRDFPQGARVVLAQADSAGGIATLKAGLAKTPHVLEDTRECGAAVSAHTGPGTVALFAAPLQP
jgi:DegV family protein with EDD domain